jgi:hypothetical protein
MSYLDIIRAWVGLLDYYTSDEIMGIILLIL